MVFSFCFVIEYLCYQFYFFILFLFQVCLVEDFGIDKICVFFLLMFVIVGLGFGCVIFGCILDI